MEYLTSWLNKKVYAPGSDKTAIIKDLVAANRDPLPEVVALQVALGAETFSVPLAEFAQTGKRFELPQPFGLTPRYTLLQEDFLLRKSILDRQIVDLHGKRVVRVNDVALIWHRNRLVIVGVEAGLLSLLRRLGLEKLALKLPRRIRRKLMSQIIAWNEVETFGTAVKLKIPHEKIAQLHPADIADIIEQLDPAQRTQVIESLDLETAADMLEETEPEVQRAIIESMDVEKAADIVEEMEPDEAADLLGDLSEARSEELLEHMEAEEAADVKELLAFDEDTAGGMMTTEYVAIPDSLTAADTIDRLRDLHPDAEIIYYIYVVDEDEQLVGVLSLRELIVAQPNMLISDIMEKNAITVHTNSSPEDVAQVMDKYNLLAVPVVDMENRLRGIVTVDDTLSTLVPQLRRHRQQQGSQG